MSIKGRGYSRPDKRPMVKKKAVKKITQEERGKIGRVGEDKIVSKLYNLDGCFKIYRNLLLPRENGRLTETDVIVVTKKGIIIIESKNYTGWIFGKEKSSKWTHSFLVGSGRAKKVKFHNPIRQNERHVNAVMDFIGESLPCLSLIIFGDEAELKSINYCQSNTLRVINLCELEYTLDNLGYLNQGPLDNKGMDLIRKLDILENNRDCGELEPVFKEENLHSLAI